MTKKHIITVAGRLGSGKSSTAKTLATTLGYEHFSSGDLFREVAAAHGEDVLSANKSAERNSAIDNLVDTRLREIGEQEDMKVIDSRTAWHWIPQSFKVYLYLDTAVAARRIIAAMKERENANEDIPTNPDEYVAMLNERISSENSRYMRLYGIDPSLPENYDLVIDTAEHDLKAVVEMIRSAYQKWLDS